MAVICGNDFTKCHWENLDVSQLIPRRGKQGGKWGQSGWVKAVGVGGGSGGLNETYTAPVGLSRFVFNIMI